MRILALKLDCCCTAAITGRSHCSRSLEVVQKTLDLCDVYLLGRLRATDHFGRVDLTCLRAATGLVSSAVGLSGQHGML